MHPVSEMLGLMRNVPYANAQTDRSAYSKGGMYLLQELKPPHGIGP